MEEESAVLKTIFDGNFDESWSEDVEFVRYVSELTSYGVDRLARECDHLTEEKHHVDKQTEDLAFNNYKTFIQTATCSRDIFKDFQIIESSLTELQGKLPEFSAECQRFVEAAQAITQSRKSNTLTLHKHTQLLEILELPQLMDTCVRNGYYDEALELAAYVKRLEKKYSSISVIKTICEEVKRCTQLLLSQLLQQLRSDIQLPACLRIIGFLRHMDIFTEAELRLKFLQARDTWFKGVISTIPTADAYLHLTKVIEMSRVHLFDIITQYKAIFTDDELLYRPAASQADYSGPREAMFLQSWVQTKVDEFVETLVADLGRGGGSSRLDSLLGQCMYFGLSFSRVGCDLRPLIAEVFKGHAVDSFTHSLARANDSFDKAMETYSLVLCSSLQAFTAPAVPQDELSPPYSLLQFSPLAVYCNNVLSAFNDLLACAPLNLVVTVTPCLERSLSRVADTINNFHRMEHQSFTREEQISFSKMCQVFSRHLIPFLNKCLQVLFPPAYLAKYLGLTTQHLHVQGSNIYSVDVDVVLEPLKAFLPEEAAEEVAVAGKVTFDIVTGSSDTEHEDMTAGAAQHQPPPSSAEATQGDRPQTPPTQHPGEDDSTTGQHVTPADRPASDERTEVDSGPVRGGEAEEE